ncbi:MAG: chemoreceptor glutamine deamidase CheD [Alphaproteobacteria bacterium]|nr:chemoreceptor glutamine deamidase CheD [Alphaproteobacteria bacterium]
MTSELQPISRNHYFDPHKESWTTKLLPGEYCVCPQGEMVVTTLGSCIAACIRDRKLGIGGMNHFMLPQSDHGEWAGVALSARYGNYAMEHLINEILKKGGSRQNLEASIFGGGSVSGETQLQVGKNNAQFAEEYLNMESIRLIEKDVGQDYARKVYYQPKSGETFVKKLPVLPNETVKDREKDYAKSLDDTAISGNVELF